MRKIQILSRSAIVILIWSGFPALATVYDCDGSSANIQYIHDTLAQSGDTITVPAGVFTWATQVNISKAITLQGQGPNVTIVRDNCQGSTQFLRFSLAANEVSRLTGFEFQNGGRTPTAVAPNGVFKINGSNTNGAAFRMDNCKWNQLNGGIVTETVKGVVDDNDFIFSAAPMFAIYDSNWNGGLRGDSSWATPSNFGSDGFLFFEDNYILSTSTPNFTDAYAGARFVVRYNTLENTGLTNHGTEGQRNRGCRAWEIYNNAFLRTRAVDGILGNARSGVVIFHNNTATGYGPVNPRFNLNAHRSFVSEFWGAADGTNRYDANAPGGPFFTGTAAAASSGTTVRVTGANWQPNQWVGYSLKRTTNLGGLPGQSFSIVTGSGANTLTYFPAGPAYGGSLAFSLGDSLQICKVNHAIDQPGRAMGSLITGGNPPVLPAGWNDQITEPCYSWNNTQTETGAHINFAPGQPLIRPNVHFFNDTPMPGYTPYIYPHPLVTGDPTPSPTPAPSPTATVPPSPTPAPSPTATVPPSPTPAPSPTATVPPSPTPTATVTPTITPTATPTVTPTPTATPRHTPKPHPTHGPQIEIPQ